MNKNTNRKKKRSTPDSRGRLTGESLHRITGYGRSLTIPQWADVMKVSPSTLYSRRRLGYTDEEILSTERLYIRQEDKITPESTKHTLQYYAHRGACEYVPSMPADRVGREVGCSERNVKRALRDAPRTLRTGWKVSLDTAERDGGDYLHTGIGASPFYWWSRLVRRHTKMHDPLFLIVAKHTPAVCDEWRDYPTFQAWYESELDRTGVRKEDACFIHINPANMWQPYGPTSCRIVTVEEAERLCDCQVVIVDGEAFSTEILCRLTGTTPKSISLFAVSCKRGGVDVYMLRTLLKDTHQHE